MVDTRLVSLLNIVEYGSYTKAAEQLSLTQPAVSQHIKQLETILGIKIFSRKRTGVVLTKEGEVLVNYAVRVLGLTDRLKETLADMEKLPSILTIGMTDMVEASDISGIITEFAEDTGIRRVRIVTGSQEKLTTLVKNNEIDLAIFEGRTEKVNLNSVTLFNDNYVLAVSKEHPFANSKGVTFGQLKKEKLIIGLSGSEIRSAFAHCVSEEGMSIDDFNVVLETDNIYTIKDHVIQNFGVTVFPRSLCISAAKNGLISMVPVKNLVTERLMTLVYSPSFEYPELIDGIVKTCAQLKPQK